MRWLIVSVALSLVLTALLNIGLRLFPDAGHRVARGLAGLTSPNIDEGHEDHRRLRVFVPWKAMIVGSVILTIVANIVLRVV